ncbi:hypothetical protein Tco_0375181 [Tanacetum coccineum]
MILQIVRMSLGGVNDVKMMMLINKDEDQATTTADPAQVAVPVDLFRQLLPWNQSGSLEDSLHKVIQKQTTKFIREHTVPVVVVTDVLKQQQQP